MEAAKPGPGEQSMSLTTANTTAAAFDLLVDMKNWATVLEDRQELSKGTCALLRVGTCDAYLSTNNFRLAWYHVREMLVVVFREAPDSPHKSLHGWRSSHTSLL
jgi:hypothetical protein